MKKDDVRDLLKSYESTLTSLREATGCHFGSVSDPLSAQITVYQKIENDLKIILNKFEYLIYVLVKSIILKILLIILVINLIVLIK
jgi:hypothetical protein